MKLDKIDLTNLVAIGHKDNKLALLIERETEIELIEVPAPQEAYQGLKQVSSLINEEIPVYPTQPTLPVAKKKLQSSMAEAINYEPEEKRLQVEFLSGSVYEYEDVEPETWEEFCEAKSPGSFYNQEIKGMYDSRRLY